MANIAQLVTHNGQFCYLFVNLIELGKLIYNWHEVKDIYLANLSTLWPPRDSLVTMPCIAAYTDTNYERDRTARAFALEDIIVLPCLWNFNELWLIKYSVLN